MMDVEDIQDLETNIIWEANKINPLPIKEGFLIL